jgi:hypothetical protein
MRRTTKLEKQTESLTLRVEKQVLDKLREEAERSMKSINVLGNQVLKFYVNWHSVAVDAGFVYIDKKNLSRILDKLTEGEIDQILDEYFQNEFTGRIKMIAGDTDLERFLKAMEGWLSGSGLRYRQVVKNGTRSYVIQHDAGKNAAYYIMNAKNVEVKTTTDTLWVEFTV